jgi:hypothetical protein
MRCVFYENGNCIGWNGMWHPVLSLEQMIAWMRNCYGFRDDTALLSTRIEIEVK